MNNKKEIAVITSGDFVGISKWWNHRHCGPQAEITLARGGVEFSYDSQLNCVFMNGTRHPLKTETAELLNELRKKCNASFEFDADYQQALSSHKAEAEAEATRNYNRDL